MEQTETALKEQSDAFRSERQALEAEVARFRGEAQKMQGGRSLVSVRKSWVGQKFPREVCTTSNSYTSLVEIMQGRTVLFFRSKTCLGNLFGCSTIFNQHGCLRHLHLVASYGNGLQLFDTPKSLQRRPTSSSSCSSRCSSNSTNSSRWNCDKQPPPPQPQPPPPEEEEAGADRRRRPRTPSVTW